MLYEMVHNVIYFVQGLTKTAIGVDTEHMWPQSEF